MARRLPNGSIQLADGRIVYADSVPLVQDLVELLPILYPVAASQFPGFMRGGSRGGGVVGSGGGGGAGFGGGGGVGSPGIQGIPGIQGPPGPPGPAQDIFAATRVVSLDPARGTDLTIESAISNLPSQGGYILVREGTYTPPVGGYVLPDKPVKIHGCGRDATVIDLTGFTGSAFSSAFAQAYEFASFTIQGTGVVGQDAFTFSFLGFIITLPVMREINVTNVERVIVSTLATFLVLLAADCRWLVPVGLASARHWVGPGSFVANQILLADAVLGNNGGITANGGTLFVNIKDGTIAATNIMDASSWRLSLVEINDGVLTINSGGGQSRLLGCVFQGGGPVRCIDIAAGADGNTINGCQFTNFTSEAIRVASNANIIIGNRLCTVLEIGGADSNLYNSNSVFVGSTIIGPNSVCEGARRADDVDTTTDVFVTAFTHISKKGLLGIGTINNTDGANSLDVQETVIDVFSVTSSQVNTVAAGATRLLNPEINIGTARPPYLSYMVEVRSTVPGSPATFELHHVSQGSH